ncbi:BMP family ABC transporter substrate-binding protein [Candidatus Cryosericum terrychapinii]|uniref:BMP family ABC transporter substrate-binding protein n=1 Tax=Candidatus Cryosericum terrychapinii TaxID=2290919 RepID=A0A398CYI1_9BACT|nr:BMP family ABC transporter substrate-binding protein [Candidatus Cryosericum terrychapinii]RIE05588.1 BMP family ABC transporter substrate-binding protein [Candidatus Cryosericum terrychapinii]
MKRMLCMLLALMIISMSFAGCKPTVTGPKTDKVVYLINGALGDNAFYDSGQKGIDNIKAQYGVETSTIECNFDAGKYEPGLEAATQYSDVVFVISYAFEDNLKAMADKYPDKIFVNIDTIVENSKSTITSIKYIEEESAFLAGVCAGLTTTDMSIKNVNADKVVGVVAAADDPVVMAFVKAYEDGVHYIDKTIKIERVVLAGIWDDPAKGKQAALSLYDKKCDVVFQVAAATGLGVLQAAKERGLYAIGVDTNQNDIEPGYVIASDIKDVGKTIEDVYKTIKDGTYKPGQVIKYGLKTGTVDLVTEATVQVLPQSIIDRIGAVRQQIVDGTLAVTKYQ